VAGDSIYWIYTFSLLADNYNASFKGNYAEEAFDENYAENENYPENEYVEDPFPEAIEQKQYLGGPEVFYYMVLCFIFKTFYHSE